MPDRFFLDTNILVYTFDNKNPEKQARANLLVPEALAGGGVISWQVVQEFCNLALRTFEPKMDVASLRLYLDDVLFPLCRFFPDQDVFKEALSIRSGTQYSWYDCLIIASALRQDCKILYSEDLQDVRELRGLRIVNPFKTF